MSDCICGDMPPGGVWPKGEEPPYGCPIHGGARVEVTGPRYAVWRPEWECRITTEDEMEYVSGLGDVR